MILSVVPSGISPKPRLRGDDGRVMDEGGRGLSRIVHDVFGRKRVCQLRRALGRAFVWFPVPGTGYGGRPFLVMAGPDEPIEVGAVDFSSMCVDG